jgi:hypothetical protein
MAAVARRKCSATLEVCRPPEVQCKPPLRQAAWTLGASGGQHSGGERLKTNSGNDYREVVTRKLAVPNPFAKAENLCLTQWQGTREAVRAGFIKNRCVDGI